MTHVDEENYTIVEFDMLALELFKSTFDNDVGVIIISPWVKDYAIPVTWPSFTSNFVNITEMQRTSDVLQLLLQSGVSVTIITSSPAKLKNDNWYEKSIREATEFCEQIKNEGGKIIYNKKNHGKLTITSECYLKGSGNFTNTGRDPTLQNNAGDLINRNSDERSFNATMEWANKIIEESQSEL
jgi:hypothetical protein